MNTNSTDPSARDTRCGAFGPPPDARWAPRGATRAALPVLLLLLVLVGAACTSGSEGDDGESPTTTDIGQSTTTSVSDDGASTSPDEGSADDQLTIRLGQDIANVDPAFFPAAEDEQVAVNIFEGLVAYEPGTFEIRNELAETFEVSDDGLRFDFTLKRGVEFHHGYGELTAEDVKFSFERIAGLTDPPIDSPYQGDWSALEEVQVHDDYAGTIVLSEPFAPMMTTTLPIITGTVVSKDAVEELGEDFGTNPVGTGPYEFTSWTPDQEIVLERFDDYGGARTDYHGEVAWDTLRFVPVPEDSSADIALETGEVDFAPLSLQSIERFEEIEGIEVVDSTTPDYNWIGMNIANPALEDIRVREAIRHAIDVPGILDAAFQGRWARADTLIAPDMPLGHWEDAPVYERDVERARALLEEAGAEDLSLTFTYVEETGSDAVAEITQANLAEVGIDVELQKLDSASFYELGEQLRERQLFYAGFVTQPDPSWSATWFTCDQIDQWNWMYWCSEEYDQLHREALQEADSEERHAMYVEMQRLWDEAVHTVWIAWPTRYFGHDEGIVPAITPYGRVIPWAFEKAD